MERCRGELLRWSRRKKKWNIFPVVWTTQRTGPWDEVSALMGHPVSKERGEKSRSGEMRVGARERNRARLKDRKGGKQWLRKEKEMVRNEEREMKKGPCVLIWYPTVCASVHGHDIQTAEMWLSSWSSSNLLPMCDRKKTTSKPGACGEDRRAKRKIGLLPSCHGRRLCDPKGRVYTHGPAPAHHSPPSLASVPSAPFGGREQGKSLPQNLWHFLMTCQAECHSTTEKLRQQRGKSL